MKMQSYVTPLADRTFTVLSDGVATAFDYDYAASRDKLTSLYQKGKDLQWDTTRRIDWTR